MEGGEGPSQPDHGPEAQPAAVLARTHGHDVDDDGHRKGNRQPAVDPPNPLAPVQWDLL